MIVYIVGIGMDGDKTLTREAENAINVSELLLGAERIIKPFASLGKETFINYISCEIAEKINACKCETAAVLMSGDCGFFSGEKKLLPLLEGHDVRIIAGISSVSYFCAKVGLSYENMKFITLHGRSSNIAINVKLNEKCFFLLGGDMTVSDVCKRLCEYGLGDVTVHAGADLGYENESIISAKASELIDCKICGLAVMITENFNALKHIPSAICDEEFLREEIPMTKSEVRSIAVSKLSICSDSVVWDIGCGTGSVSVEAAYRCPDGRVIAFDKKSEAATLTNKNAKRFNCDNVFVIEGSCPEILAEQPTPNKVFIGGSSGKMNEIFETIQSKKTLADIVVTAVSIETLRGALECFERCDTIPEVVQLAVTRTKTVGTHTMLQAQNPVFIISGRLK